MQTFGKVWCKCYLPKWIQLKICAVCSVGDFDVFCLDWLNHNANLTALLLKHITVWSQSDSQAWLTMISSSRIDFTPPLTNTGFLLMLYLCPNWQELTFGQLHSKMHSPLTQTGCVWPIKHGSAGPSVPNASDHMKSTCLWLFLLKKMNFWF